MQQVGHFAQTCKSPGKVMLVAHHLASRCLRPYSSRFSRHDFTLPQLFACLAVKELLGRSYREAEALLADSPQWCHAIGMSKAPDHNTLCRAARVLPRHCSVSKVLDAMAHWAARRKVLRLSHKPLGIDSTYCQSHHVSRHYERRCAKARRNIRKDRHGRTRPRGTGETLRRLPKLALGVAAAAHLVLSVWTGTGAGSDHRHFERVLFDAWRRVPHRRLKVVADAGYDCEESHRLARMDMGIASIIPPLIGRATTRPPTSYWRRHMRRVLATPRRRWRCGYTQRWQVETVMSMIKRNLGDELSGKSAWSRRRDLLLKVLTHNLMIIRRKRGSRQSSGGPLFWIGGCGRAEREDGRLVRGDAKVVGTGDPAGSGTRCFLAGVDAFKLDVRRSRTYAGCGRMPKGASNGTRFKRAGSAIRLPAGWLSGRLRGQNSCKGGHFDD